MGKLVSLKLTKGEREEKEDAYSPESYQDEEAKGPSLHLDEHHLDKMDLPHDLPHGHEVEFRFKGRVHRSDHGSGPEGEHAHTQFRLTHGEAEHEEPKGGADNSLRAEIERHVGESDKKAAEKAKPKSEEAGEY